MSVTVCIHKCIRNGFIETVTCTCTLVVTDIVRHNQLGNKSFIYERGFNIAFTKMEKTRKTGEHSEGINEKL